MQRLTLISKHAADERLWMPATCIVVAACVRQVAKNASCYCYLSVQKVSQYAFVTQGPD